MSRFPKTIAISPDGLYLDGELFPFYLRPEARIATDLDWTVNIGLLIGPDTVVTVEPFARATPALSTFLQGDEPR